LKSSFLSLVLSAAFCLPAMAQTADASVRIAPEGVWYTVSRDETLSSISQKFTGEIRHWRSIGNINKIENDRTIPIGRIILVPARLLTPVAAFARINSLFGEIAIRDQNGSPIEAKVNALLKEGDTLSTMAKSFISLVLEDGSQITLPPDSTLNLRMLRQTHYVNSPRTRLFLERGRVESSVTPFSKPDSRYEVLSPLAISGVRGTRFRVQYQDGRATNETVDGKVAVQPEGSAKHATQLVAGGFGTVVENRRAARPISLLPEPELNGGDQRQEKLPLQFHLSQSNAAQFLVRVSKDAQGMDNIAEVDAVGNNGKGIARIADLPDGQYFVHTNAIDKHGLNGLRKSVSFEVAARPFAPFLMAPDLKFQGNSTDDRVTVPMQWSLSGDIDIYRLQVARDEKFALPVIDQIITAGDGMAQQSVALNIDTYYWRVASVESGTNKQGPFSDARRLTIIPGLSAPTTAIGEKDIHFSWSQTAPDQRFTFQLSTQADFATVLEQKDVNTPGVVITRPQPGTYYARIRSTETDGFVGAFSPPQKFIVPMQWQTEYGTPIHSQGQPLGSGF